MNSLSIPNRGAESPRRFAHFVTHPILLLTLSISLIGCASTGNNFDESKLTQIKKGETSEAQLIGLFGQPENRTVTSELKTILTWNYNEATVKGESFIPYAGAFLGGARSKAKTLVVTLADNKMTGFTYSGGGTETRGTTQDTPKK